MNMTRHEINHDSLYMLRWVLSLFAVALPLIVMGCSNSSKAMPEQAMLPADSISMVAPIDSTECVSNRDPIFPGGDMGLLKFVAKNIRHQQGCYVLKGQLYIEYLIDKEGNVADVRIKSSDFDNNDYINEEVVRVMWLLPKHEPALENGQPVESWQILPIRFRDKDY